MSFGRVKWFNSEKGYGFLETAECDQDVFVHFSDIEMDGYKTLQENTDVYFVLQKGNKGPCAKQVQRMVNDEAELSLGDTSHLWQHAPVMDRVQPRG